jgi:hypothetical protein
MTNEVQARLFFSVRQLAVSRGFQAKMSDIPDLPERFTAASCVTQHG